jgi:thioredoxin reductase (NADPH)
MDQFDVIIIGGGPAGLSTALWCDDLGLKTILLEKKSEFGGQLLRVYNRIENHLGIDAENGLEMRDRFLLQTGRREFLRKLETEVLTADLKNRTVFLKSGETLRAKAIIIATGTGRRRLGIPGEQTFKDRGIVESGRKDPEIAAGKRVLIVGGGDAAVENALILSETAERVFICHRTAEFTARDEFTTSAKAASNIEFLDPHTLENITGTERIEAVKLKNTATGETLTLPVETVLIRIGVEPNTGIFRGELETDEKGFVRIDDKCQTSLEGVYAVGDAANPLGPTLSSAVGMGATAAKAVYAYLSPPGSHAPLRA